MLILYHCVTKCIRERILTSLLTTAYDESNGCAGSKQQTVHFIQSEPFMLRKIYTSSIRAGKRALQRLHRTLP